jgi:predicted metal-dependent peptidase
MIWTKGEIMNGIISTSLTAEEKLTRARVQLQKEKPFFSYLCMHLNFIEMKEIETMGVDRYGNLYYNTSFVDTLTDEEIKGCLAHEVMHCALEHLERGEGREPEVFNISSDIVINNILTKDNFQIPKGCLVPHNNQFKIFGIELKGLEDQTSEEVYDKIWKVLAKQFNRVRQQIKKFIQDQEKKGIKGFDKHIYGNGNGKKGDKSKCGHCAGTGKCPKCNGTGCPDCNGTGKCTNCNGTGEIEKNPVNTKKIDWKKTLVDACSYARQRGDVPAGMERMIGKLFDTYIDWRGLLYRYITSQIPVDYTWARPSKKSHSLGIYLPAVERESIEVMVAVDTSGSISQKELTEFISEISSIVNSFKNVELTIMDCDCQVNGVHTMRNATAEQVIHDVGKNLRGGGGTSHKPVFNWINKNKPTAKFVICFTDGYTEFPSKSEVKQPVLWVVAGNYRQEKGHFPYGDVIELPKRLDD